jgi:predicted nucleic acid-binding protein
MTILETNVISALMNDPPEDRVVAWLDSQARTSIWTTSITVFEVRSGLEIMPAGRRQAKLSEVFEGILDRLGQRIAVFDDEAARRAANLTAARRKKGRVVDLRDTMVAGIVLARQAAIATRNTAHFSDIPATIINPWVA